MKKAFFFDRDGIINIDRGRYTYLIDDFEINEEAIPLMRRLKLDGFLLIVVTNQAGIAKGEYSREQMHACHQYFQETSGNLVDEFYYAPDHPTFSESLSRKPDSLMFERAIAKFGIDPGSSWMIGDMERDITPAKKLGIRTIRLREGQVDTEADYQVQSLGEVVHVLNHAIPIP